MSNSKDQHPQEKEEATSPRKRKGSSAQESDRPKSKRFRIITKEEEYMWSLPQDMASYADDNSEKYIPKKDVKEIILIKSPRPENLDPVKKTVRLPAGTFKTEKEVTRYWYR